MYLDPGFGGMLLQVIVVIAAVGGGILFSVRKKISGIFRKDGNKAKTVYKNKKTLHASAEAGDDAVDTLDENGSGA